MWETVPAKTGPTAGVWASIEMSLKKFTPQTDMIKLAKVPSINLAFVSCYGPFTVSANLSTTAALPLPALHTPLVSLC